jgi:hypothetical protein
MVAAMESKNVVDYQHAWSPRNLGFMFLVKEFAMQCVFGGDEVKKTDDLRLLRCLRDLAG